MNPGKASRGSKKGELESGFGRTKDGDSASDLGKTEVFSPASDPYSGGCMCSSWLRQP